MNLKATFKTNDQNIKATFGENVTVIADSKVFEEIIETLTEQNTEYKTELEDTAQAITSIGVEGATINNTAEKIDDVYKTGKQAEYDRFWDTYQKNGKRTDYTNAFSYGWNDETYNPKYDINVAGGNMLYIYQNTEITDTKINVKVASGTARRLFYNASNLKTIRKLIINSSVPFAQCFDGCTGLENLTIEGRLAMNGFDVRWSTLLSKESIISIINALVKQTVETSPTITLSLKAINKAFETSEGANDGSTSTEWITLITPKSNSYDGIWNITLV